MKTKITFAILSLLLNTVLLAGGNIKNATTGKDTLAITATSMSLPSVEDESYINDIPFDTRAIALKSLFSNLARPEVEEYINDIPFNTEEIAADYNYKTNKIEPEEEEYVDDIPFNTAQIVKEYNANGYRFASECDNNKSAE